MTICPAHERRSECCQCAPQSSDGVGRQLPQPRRRAHGEDTRPTRKSVLSSVERRLVARSKAHGGAGLRHSPRHHQTLIKITHTHDSANSRPVFVGDRGEVTGSGLQHPRPLLWPYEYLGGPVWPVLTVAIEVFEDGLIKAGTSDGHAMRVHGIPLSGVNQGPASECSREGCVLAPSPTRIGRVDSVIGILHPLHSGQYHQPLALKVDQLIRDVNHCVRLGAWTLEATHRAMHSWEAGTERDQSRRNLEGGVDQGALARVCPQVLHGTVAEPLAELVHLSLGDSD